MQNLTQLSLVIHEANRERGFYDEELEIERILSMNYEGDDPLAVFVRNAMKNQKLMLIVTEVAEACEATRMTNGGYTAPALVRNALLIEDDATFATMYKSAIKDRFEAELAGTFIRLMDFCGRYNVDIQAHVDAELRYNRTRPYKHAKTC